MNSYYHSKHSCAIEFNFRKHSSCKTPLSRRLLSAEAQGRLRRSCSPLLHSPLSQALTAARVGRRLTGGKKGTLTVSFLHFIRPIIFLAEWFDPTETGDYHQCCALLHWDICSKYSIKSGFLRRHQHMGSENNDEKCKRAVQRPICKFTVKRRWTLPVCTFWHPANVQTKYGDMQRRQVYACMQGIFRETLWRFTGS